MKLVFVGSHNSPFDMWSFFFIRFSPSTLYSFLTSLFPPFPHLLIYRNYLLCRIYRITSIPSSEQAYKPLHILAPLPEGSLFLLLRKNMLESLRIKHSLIYMLILFQSISIAICLSCSHKSIPSKKEMSSTSSSVSTVGMAYPKISPQSIENLNVVKQIGCSSSLGLKRVFYISLVF